MTSIQPNVTGTGTSPLKDSMALALALFGDSNIDMQDGSLAHLLLYAANMVVDEVNSHPYRTGLPLIERYVHPSDKRDIDDTIMIQGIAAHYATQQASAKAQTLLATYYRKMNAQLWLELNGNSPLSIRAFDKARTNSTSGQPEEAS